jgi:Transglutaminase-like superfamily
MLRNSRGARICREGSMSRLAYLLLAPVCTLCVGVAAAQEPTDNPTESKAAPESRTQKWEFGISVRAVGGPCAGLLGTFPVPSDWPEQTVKIASEEISPLVQRHAYREQEGLKQMVFEVPQLSSGGSAECFITFEITKRIQLPPNGTANLVIPKDPPREVKRYLNPSPLIEVTNAKVRSLARDLPAGKDTAWEQVQAIVSGVRDKVQYEQDTKNVMKGAIGALRDGKADREDMTATFVAICRAAKIPARMVWAMDYCYAEFYLDEKETDDDKTAADDKSAKEKKGPKAKKEPKGAWYPCVVHEQAEVGACADFRPIIEKGDNFKVPEDKSVQRYIKEFLTGKGGTGGKPAVEFRRRLAD